MRRNHLCDNCAKKGHIANYCFSKSLCKVTDCKQKHHSLLHRPKPSGNNNSSPATSTSDIPENSQSSATGQQQQPRPKFSSVAAIRTSSVYLNVVPVQVSAGDKYVNTFAFLDQGLTTTLCDRRLLTELDVTGEDITFSISTVNESATLRQGQKVNLLVTSLWYKNNYCCRMFYLLDNCQ